MKIIGIVLAALIVLIQYPLWLGKGGWLRAWDVDRQLAAQRGKNEALQARNAALARENQLRREYLERLKDNQTEQELEIRRRWKLVKPNEKVYMKHPGE